MNEIIQAIILGIVQGITEWLPISSSGHLVIFQKLFNLTNQVSFDLMLHFASLLVVLIVFREDIIKLVNGSIKKEKKYLNYLYFLIIGTIPIVLAGFFLNGIVKSSFENVKLVGIFLIVTGLLLYASKFKRKKQKLSKKNALIIGIAQMFALFPGISRSGSTISVGLMQGINRKEAARFSFLLFIPALIGAMILEFQTFKINTPVIAGTLTSFIVGYFSLIWLLKIINKGKLHYFSYYCIILGLIQILL